MVYTITLNPALDYVMKVDNLRYDDVNRTSSEALFYGGKGINVSVILTRLGIENTALGFVAGFTGAKLEEMLKSDGISCDFTHTKTGYTRINVKVKSKTELDINANGPAVDPKEIEDLLKKIDGISSGDYLVMAGSVPQNMPEDIYEQIMQRLQDKGINFVVDTTGDLLMNSLKYRPFLVKPNHHELGDLFGVTLENEADVAKYAKKLIEMGARNVLVSRAGDGAMLVDENGAIHSMGCAKGKLVNSVGCGDSMVGGFIAGYSNTKDYGYALKLGSACGSATAFSLALATKEEIESVLENGFDK